MLTIKLTNLDTKEVIKKQLPQDWHELSLAMFCRLMDCYQVSEEPNNFEIVGALLDIPISWLKDAKLKDIDNSIFYYIEFLKDADKWANIWSKPPKITEIDGHKFERIDDISEHLTLGQKEEILQAFNNTDIPYIEKSVLVLKTLYNEFENVNFIDQAAIRIFPIVAFFLTSLKRSLILGRLRSEGKRQTRRR